MRRRSLCLNLHLNLPEPALNGWRRASPPRKNLSLSKPPPLLPELPAEISRKLPRYPLIPAALFGRLAVDQTYRNQGFGRFLLADALFQSWRSEIASFVVVVDAKDEPAKRFYERESFLPFPGQPLKLFRPMADIAALFR